MNSTYAILISVDTYQSEDVSNLPFCNNDLALMKECMTTNLNIPPENILLLGEEPNTKVTRSEILRAINYTKKLSKDINTLIFYFSGHGTSYNKEGYLVTYDTEIDLPADTSISLSRIIDEFKTTQIKSKLLIIDSCFSGIDFSKGVKKIFEDLDDNIDLMLAEGWSLLASCKGTELSYMYTEKNASVFTYFLSEAFNELAHQDEKGQVSIDDINDYILKKVAKWSLENKKMQTPNLKSERVGSLYFDLKKSERRYELAKESAAEISVTEEKSTKLILSAEKYFPSSETFSSLLISGIRPISLTTMGIPRESESNTISYTNEQREVQLQNYEANFLDTFFGQALQIIKPSQISQVGEKSFELPFCNINLEIKERFTSKISLTIDQSKIDDQVESFLKTIDNQTSYHWRTVEYSFDGNFDFDLLVDNLISNEYTISKYNLSEKTLFTKYGTESNSLNIRFQNINDEAYIAIEKYLELPKDFFDILPIDKIVTDFYGSIRDKSR